MNGDELAMFAARRRVEHNAGPAFDVIALGVARERARLNHVTRMRTFLMGGAVACAAMLALMIRPPVTSLKETDLSGGMCALEAEPITLALVGTDAVEARYRACLMATPDEPADVL